MSARLLLATLAALALTVAVAFFFLWSASNRPCGVICGGAASSVSQAPRP